VTPWTHAVWGGTVPVPDHEARADQLERELPGLVAASGAWTPVPADEQERRGEDALNRWHYIERQERREYDADFRAANAHLWMTGGDQ
jgi:hypothetical protein